MKPHKKRRKYKTPATLYKLNTVKAVGQSMIRTPQYPQGDDAMNNPVWPATKAQTPVPVLPNQVVKVDTAPVAGMPAMTSTVTTEEPKRKLSPAELLAQKKKFEANEKMPVKKQFFTTLKALRMSLGLTGNEVATHLKLSDGGYNKIELGYGVNLNIALQIAEFFDKPVEELWQLDRENIPQNPEE